MGHNVKGKKESAREEREGDKVNFGDVSRGSEL